jgi:dipeptidyl aminopeptidase/acylaminoacyl peptidase
MRGCGTVTKALALAAALAAASTCAAAADARTISLDDYASLVRVSDVAISPDGKAIVCIVSRADMKENRYAQTLTWVDAASGEQRALTYRRRGLSSPAWSPDGGRIAFLADVGSGKDARQQIFVMDMRGGDPVPVTKAPLGVQQFAWRPDGAALAYVASDEAPNKKDIDAHRDGFVVGDQAYNDDAAPTIARIWEIAADGTGARQLTSGTFSLPSAQPPSSPGAPISWSPDGREIAFTKMPNAYDADGDLAVVAILDVQSGAIRTLTSHGKYEGYGEFSPDGKRVSYWYPYGGDPAAQNDVFVAPSSGGDGTDVTAAEIDTNVQRAMWMPDGTLLISGHKGTDAALWIKPLDAPARRIDLGGVQPVQSFWLDASVSRSGAIAFAGSEANRPVELYYLASAASKPRRLTSYNQAIADLHLGKVAPVAWSFEGFAEDGVLTYPPDYDPAKRYPLVLVVHGGPNSASIAAFNVQNQVLAARGWLVFNPNYRGSDNLGEAYWHAIVGDAGAGPGRDAMAGIDAVEKVANVDASRLAVSGWSYGGYMTSWLTGHYHQWKAAVAGAAVNNLVDQYALADNGVQWRYGFGGSPWTGQRMAQYLEQSPLTYARAIVTPTLILSDTRDQRVPVTQSYEMYHTLKDAGTPVEFWVYPVGGHFPSDPVRSLDVLRRWTDWLAAHL